MARIGRPRPIIVPGGGLSSNFDSTEIDFSDLDKLVDLIKEKRVKKAQIEAGVPEGIAGTPQGAQFLANKELDIIKQQQIKDEEQTFLQRLRTATRQPQQFGVPEAQVGGGGLIPEQNLTEGFETTLGQTFLSPEQEAKALTARELPADVQSNFFSTLLGIKPPAEQQKPLSNIGKVGFDRRNLVDQFGEDSPQVKSFDELLKTSNLGTPFQASADTNEIALAKFGKQFRNLTQKERREVLKEEKAPQVKQRGFKLRSQFLSEPLIRRYDETKSQYLRMNALWSKFVNNPQDQQGKGFLDQGLIVIFNKMLDPQSVVRESEFARTPEFIALENRIKGWLPKLREGGAGLTDADRQQMVEDAKTMFEATTSVYNSKIDDYKGLASAFDVPENMLGIKKFDVPDVPRLGAQTPKQKRLQELREKARRG